jgi:hypothetical protein
MNALRFLVEYGPFTEHDDDGRLTIEDYAEYVGISRAQAFRRQQAFRKCFPNDDVHALWDVVRPLLNASPFSHEGPKAQAVFVSSIKVKLSA